MSTRQKKNKSNSNFHFPISIDDIRSIDDYRQITDDDAQYIINQLKILAEITFKIISHERSKQI